VILQNCFTLARREAIAEYISSVIGINKRFAEIFLGAFYIDGPYYEVFAEAHRPFLNRAEGAQEAALIRQPKPRFANSPSFGLPRAGDVVTAAPGRDTSATGPTRTASQLSGTRRHD
jgi:hypothetical protein